MLRRFFLIGLVVLGTGWLTAPAPGQREGAQEGQQSNRASGARNRQQRQQRPRRGRSRNDANSLAVGEVAPVFTLKSLDGKSESDLTKLRKEKPVVLLFGSYT